VILMVRKKIIYPDKYIHLRLAKTEDDLLLAKQVDDNAFGIHHGITLDELRSIHAFGKVLLLQSENGEVIGETQIITHPIKQMRYHFSFPVAFCYGIAIDPKFQGHGYGKILAIAQEELAIKMGISEIQMTVRVENYPSIKLWLSAGYEIYHYDPNFYGQDVANDARLFLKKDFSKNTQLGQRWIKATADVTFGDGHDLDAHIRIAELLKSGHIGVDVNRKGISFA
jgi:ribosomal protein S18 acetylase RimI-like enzyme